MNPQFLIEKLAANATETSWSQAYSTLNFYVTLSVSVEETGEKPITQIGKEMLERLQREYFSLDEKSIESIKKAVENTIASVETNIKHSLILVTNNQDTLYIITAGPGTVSIKRGEKFGIIAKGQLDSVLPVTGPLQDGDIIIIQTDDFAHKLTPSVLNPYLHTANITELSENIAPLLHADSTGGEAAILLQYINPEATVITDTPSIEDEPIEEEQTTNDYSDESVTELLTDSPKQKKLPLPAVSLSSLKNGISVLQSRKKLFLGLLILVLLIILVGSIIIRSHQEQSADNSAAIEQTVSTATAEYEEGIALESINRPLALEKFTKAKELLTKTAQQYPNDKNIKAVTSLLAKVDTKLSQFSSGVRVENGEEVATAQDLEIDALQTVTVKGGTLIVTDKANTLVTLTNDGEIKDSFDLETKTIIDSTSNRDFAYLLTDTGVQEVDLGNGSEDELFELDSARKSIDIFGSNLYILNSADKMVEKYSPSSYRASNYLENPLETTPVSLGIDGSIYVVLDSGKVQKFTRGVEDGYTVTGIQGSVSKNSQVFSAQDYTYVYILDKTNQRLLITSKNGEVKQEFSWNIFSSAVDFTVDESSKTIYIATPKSLYSFAF